MSELKIKAILFDLGNVIVNFDLVKTEKEYSAYGKFREGSIVDYILESDNANKYMAGKITSSQFYSRTCRRFYLKVRYGQFYEIWNNMFSRSHEMESLIKNIKEKYPKIKMVLISNTNEEHYNFLREEYKILDLLDGHVVSHEVGCQTPCPDIFNEALKVTGTISKDTFYADDRPDLIEAARVMGFRAFQFTGADELKKQLAKCGLEL